MASRTILTALLLALIAGCGDDPTGDQRSTSDAPPEHSCSGVIEVCIPDDLLDRFVACRDETPFPGSSDPVTRACETCIAAELGVLVGDEFLTLEESRLIGDCFEATGDPG